MARAFDEPPDCHKGHTAGGAAVNDMERVASYRRLMVGSRRNKEEIMNEMATRLLFAAAALSAFAAVLASAANAYVPEGAGVPAEIYAAPTTPVTSQQHSQQKSFGERLGEIGAWAAPSISHQKPQLLQRTSVGERLGEIGAWAAPSMTRSKQTPLATHPTIPNVDPSTFDGYRG
jgi:hypothetical protein